MKTEMDWMKHAEGVTTDAAAWSNPYEIQVASTGAVIARVDDPSLEAIAAIVRREVHKALYDSPEHEDDVPFGREMTDEEEAALHRAHPLLYTKEMGDRIFADEDEERVEPHIVTVKGNQRKNMQHRMEGQSCQRCTTNLKVVSFASIMDYLERLYAETMFSPDYLFLNEADYEHLQYNAPHIAQMRRYSTRDFSNVNKRGYVVKIGGVGGKYVTLATLPDLQEGEIMVLYDYQ